jgi:crossover junction endodeoxyribonuclease RuvC
MIIIGFDPGLRSGSYAALDHHGGFIAAGDIPQEGDRINARDFNEVLMSLLPKGDTMEVCIELVGARPGQGIVSTGRFLRATGAIEAVCSLTATTPVMYVTPQEWKKHFGLSSNKGDSVIAAKRLWPEATDVLKRVKDHGRAEALLIAEFWRQELGFNAIGECGK